MKRHAIKALLLVLLVVGVAWAASTSVTSKNRTLQALPALSHDGVAAADSTDWIQPLDPRAITGNQVVYVDAVFLESGATLVVWVGTYFETGGTYTKLTTSSLTLTADTTQKVGGWYPADPPGLFNLGVATHYDLRIEAPSAGVVDVRHWIAASRPE